MENFYIQIRLEVSYKDGNSFSAIITKEWEQLTGNIRGQFLRTGKQVLYQFAFKDRSFQIVKRPA